MDTKVTRGELYKLVWDTPINQLAKQYGLSDVGFVKHCKRLKVPTPPRGYWARVKSGQKPRIPRLPKPNSDTPSSHTFSRNNKSQASHMEQKRKIRDDALQIIESIQKNKAQLIVPTRLVKPDPLITEVRQIMDKYSPDKYGVIQPWGKRLLNIRVAPNNIKRALIIMNYIIKQVEKFDGKITQFTRYRHSEESRCISFLGEQIEFFIEEKVDRFDYQPTKKELKKYSWQSYQKWSFKPSGKLSLRIDFSLWDTKGLRKTWSDKKDKKIEEQIPNFLIATVIAANALRDKREIEGEKERLRKLERQRLREIERQEQLEFEKLERLELDAKNWEKAARLREYIKAVEGKIRHENPDKLPDEGIKWISWATKHADNIDPIK